jgi:hypothetical protein
MFTVISFFTKNWEYPAKAKLLQNDCERLGLDFVIDELKDSGDWIANTRKKTNFVYTKLIELKRPVLWVDCDSRIKKAPTIDLSFDIGLVRRKNAKDRTFYASSLFFNYTPESVKIAKRWSQVQGVGSDHWALEKIYQEGFDASVLELPAQYCHLSEESDSIIITGLSKDSKKLEYLNRKNQNMDNAKMLKVCAKAHFSSSQFGTFTPGEVFMLPADAANRYAQQGFVAIETYEVKPHVEVPSIPTVAGTVQPSSSSPAAPVSRKRTLKPRAKKQTKLSA